MTNSNEQAGKARARRAEAGRAEAVELDDEQLEQAAGGLIGPMFSNRFSSIRPVVKLFSGRRWKGIIGPAE